MKPLLQNMVIRRKAGNLLVLALPRFQCGHGLFQLFQFFPGAGQHPCLGIEFFPRHQVQPGEGSLQQGVNILFQILLCTLDAASSRVLFAKSAGF